MTNQQLQWHKERQKGIGGSDSAAILGLNPFKTPLQVYNEKVASDPVITDQNDAMYWGTVLEDVVAQEYQRRSSNKITKINKQYVHKEYDWIRANIDRRINSVDNDGPGVLEAKTASGWAVKGWETEMPLYYYFQVQHYFMVTGYKWGSVALLVDGRDFSIFNVEYDQDIQDQMLKKYDDFWHNNVLKQIPPDPMSEEDVKALWPKSFQGEIIASNGVINEAHAQLKNIKGQMKILKKEEAELKLTIQQAMQNAEAVIDQGKPIFTWKSHEQEKFDKSKFALEHPTLYGEYVETQTVRKFLIK